MKKILQIAFAIFGVIFQSINILASYNAGGDLMYKNLFIKSHTETYSYIDFNNDLTYNTKDTIYYYKTYHAKQSIEFDINAYNKDFSNIHSGKSNNYTISWDNGIPESNLTIYNNHTDSAYAHFLWNPTNVGISANPYCFYVTIENESFPNNKKVLKFSIKIDIDATVHLNINNASICSDSSLTLVASTNVSNPTYVWKWNNMVLNIAQNSNTFIYLGQNFLPGIDTISVTVSNSTIPTNIVEDKAIVELIYQPKIYNTFSDTGFCDLDSLMLDVGQGAQYIWKNGLDSIIGSNQTQVFSSTGIYSVYVNGKPNSQCFDTDTFSLFTSIKPPTELGEDTVLKPYDSITLSAASGYTYLWSTNETSQQIVLYGHEITNSGTNTIWVNTYNNYCISYDTIRIYTLAAINNTNNNCNFNIYPNPNNGDFDIRFDEWHYDNLRIIVYNLLGKIIFIKNLSPISNGITKHIKLPDIANGIYLIQFNSNNSTVFSSKLIIDN